MCVCVGGGGGDSYLKSDFLEGRVTKTFKFCLENGRGWWRGWHMRSPPTLPPPQKKKLESAPCHQNVK